MCERHAELFNDRASTGAARTPAALAVAAFRPAQSNILQVLLQIFPRPQVGLKPRCGTAVPLQATSMPLQVFMAMNSALDILMSLLPYQLWGSSIMQKLKSLSTHTNSPSFRP